MGDSPERLIEQGLCRLDIDDPGRRIVDQSVAYLDLLAKWNRVYNLTAVDEPLAMVGVHLMDSFSISPYVQGPLILDAGSGAGLPGIPLAIRFPDKDFILLDSNTRKTRFMAQVAIELALSNVTVVAARVEAFTGEVDQVVCRAFSSLANILGATRHLLGPGGRVLAMKGAVPEPCVACSSFRQENIPLDVPFLDRARHLCVLTLLPK